MRALIIDCETSPISRPLLDLIQPEFKAPAGYRDPEKITAHIQAQKEDWIKDAALSPLTGRILCIGIIDGTGFGYIGDDDEAVLLKRFWAKMAQDDYYQWPVVGFNIEHFDMPFIIRRSFKHGIIPSTQVFRGRYLDNRFVDLMKLWQCGDYREFISLDRLAKFLGVGEKTGSGADFAGLWEVNRDSALEYLKNDLFLTQKCANRMGVGGV